MSNIKSSLQKKSVDAVIYAALMFNPFDSNSIQSNAAISNNILETE